MATKSYKDALHARKGRGRDVTELMHVHDPENEVHTNDDSELTGLAPSLTASDEAQVAKKILGKSHEMPDSYGEQIHNQRRGELADSMLGEAHEEQAEHHMPEHEIPGYAKTPMHAQKSLHRHDVMDKDKLHKKAMAMGHHSEEGESEYHEAMETPEEERAEHEEGGMHHMPDHKPRSLGERAAMHAKSKGTYGQYFKK